MNLHGETKLYVGTISGQMGVVPAIAMVVTADDTPRPTAFFRIVFFFGTEPVVVRGQADDDAERGPDVYAGVATDPRGWDVNWRGRVEGEKITGEYHQPHDQGTLVFREVE